MVADERASNVFRQMGIENDICVVGTLNPDGMISGDVMSLLGQGYLSELKGVRKFDCILALKRFH